jgi:hypothetical protein
MLNLKKVDVIEVESRKVGIRSWVEEKGGIKKV